MHSKTHHWCLTKHIKTAFSSVSVLITPKKIVHEGCLTFIFSARLQEDPSQGKSTLPKSRMKQSPLFISSQPMPDNWNGNYVPADTRALAENYPFHTPHSFCCFSTQLFLTFKTWTSIHNWFFKGKHSQPEDPVLLNANEIALNILRYFSSYRQTLLSEEEKNCTKRWTAPSM